jgi:molybdopterin/thiamine biosynthesis adenylyltransferase
VRLAIKGGFELTRFNIEGFEDGELDYYSRQIVMDDFGLGAQRKLKASTVCIVGVGGLGSPAAIQLASMGVGKLRIVDLDVVEASNLQRQHLYGIEQVGLAKVEAAEARLRSLNPYIEVEALPWAVSSLNASDVIEGADVVLGCLDTMAPRYALNRACLEAGIPFIHGAAITVNGSVSTILPGKTACLECFQGGIDDASMPTCATVGVHPSIVNIVASLMVTETVRIITGQEPELAGKLMFIDLKDYSFEVIQLQRAEACKVCGLDPSIDAVEFEEFSEICGREGRRVFVFTPRAFLDLSMADVNSRLVSLGYDPVVKGRLGTTFTGEGDVQGSLLKSGVLILEGVNDEAAARSIRGSLLD